MVVLSFLSNCVAERRDAWSRVGQLIEVDDVKEGDAIAFLTHACRHKLSQKEIRLAYDQLTGGRPMLLRAVANSIQSGQNLERTLCFSPLCICICACLIHDFTLKVVTRLYVYVS